MRKILTCLLPCFVIRMDRTTERYRNNNVDTLDATANLYCSEVLNKLQMNKWKCQRTERQKKSYDKWHCNFWKHIHDEKSCSLCFVI